MLSRAAFSTLRAASAFTTPAARSVHTLPELPYDYGALEPVVSGRIMEIHHSKHHQTYVNNLNKILEDSDAATKAGDTAKVQSLQQGLRFNGGGHLNHTEFWNSLAPTNAAGGGQPSSGSPLAKAIDEAFGSFDNFISQFNTQTAAIQGSGWGWLVYNPRTQKLSITGTANQDRPEDMGPVRPVLGVRSPLLKQTGNTLL
eukprot:TRINITY_DN1673_c0_g1_i3.p2 TRINITY_DN1673_c0_g1~~TRINITY_DN1673_c0_g1_i3.p2  ORF type:complete len:200 (-),score=41.99 TRINITY_DN1673_c0_g1_i3:642-1241(-)